MEFIDNFGELIRSLRKKRGISQLHLSEVAGLDRTYISMLECNKKSPTLSTLIKIAEALEIKPSEILKRLGL